MTTDLLSIAAYAASTILVYDLFVAFDRKLSLLAMTFSILACAVSAIGAVLHLIAGIVLKSAHYLSFFTEPLRSLALPFLRLRTEASNLALALFVIHCLVTGYLILRKREALKCRQSY